MPVYDNNVLTIADGKKLPIHTRGFFIAHVNGHSFIFDYSLFPFCHYQFVISLCFYFRK